MRRSTCLSQLYRAYSVYSVYSHNVIADVDHNNHADGNLYKALAVLRGPSVCLC